MIQLVREIFCFVFFFFKHQLHLLVLLPHSLTCSFLSSSVLITLTPQYSQLVRLLSVFSIYSRNAQNVNIFIKKKLVMEPYKWLKPPGWMDGRIDGSYRASFNGGTYWSQMWLIFETQLLLATFTLVCYAHIILYVADETDCRKAHECACLPDFYFAQLAFFLCPRRPRRINCLNLLLWLKYF